MAKRGLVKIIFITSFFIFDIIFLTSGATSKLEVSFLDVGQGDSILIESPGGSRVIIDSGKPGKVMTALSKQINFATRGIDYLILTHPDADHIGGAPEIISRYEVKNLILSGDYLDGALASEVLRLAKEKNIPTRTISRGQLLDLGGGVGLLFLFPDRNSELWEPNTSSIVLKLLYGNTSFLFMGDTPLSVEKYLIYLDSNYLKSDVLKVGHHGSRTSSSKEFIEKVSPTYAIISAEENNSYGHPHSEVLDILKSSTILETSREGNITFVSDSKKVWVK